MSANVQIEGMDSLLKKLKAMGPSMEAAGVEAVTESAVQAQQDMQDRVRVDTGALRDSIRIEGEGLEQRVGPGDEERDKALANEFGTSRMSAQPYVVPALEAQRRDFPSVLGNKVSEAVTKL